MANTLCWNFHIYFVFKQAPSFVDPGNIFVANILLIEIITFTRSSNFVVNFS